MDGPGENFEISEISQNKKKAKSLDFLSFVEYAHVCTCVCMSACLYNREIERES